MDSEDIRRVTALMERHGIAAFDYESGAVQLHLTLGSRGQELAPAKRPKAAETVEHLCSPGVGIFLSGHPALSAVPQPLPRNAAKGEIVAYIRTGQTLRAVVATRDCILRRALVPQGRGVDHGEALFEITPD